MSISVLDGAPADRNIFVIEMCSIKLNIVNVFMKTVHEIDTSIETVNVIHWNHSRMIFWSKRIRLLFKEEKLVWHGQKQRNVQPSWSIQ